MIIDSHTHIGFPGGSIVATVDDLLASMKVANIDKALVFSGRLNNCLNDKLIENIAPYKGKLYGVGYGSPTILLPTVNEWTKGGFELNQEENCLSRMEDLMRSKQICALKFYPGYEYFYPADISIRPLLELCQTYDIPAIFHTGDCYTKAGVSKLKYAHPLAIDDLAAEMPKLKIIMAHIGNPWIVDAAAVAYNKPNVWADCSGFICGKFTHQTRAKFENALHYFIEYVETPEKLLFGSDWPIADQENYINSLSLVINSSKTFEMLTSTNAVELFKLRD